MYFFLLALEFKVTIATYRVNEICVARLGSDIIKSFEVVE